MSTEAVYSSAQVARMLGVSGGMVRRYAMALEALTGEEIPQHPRDGRQFARAHVDALISARRFVAGRQGMSVETGLRLALGLAELPAAAHLPTPTSEEGLAGAEAFKTALSEHFGPLLTQLQTLAESNAQLVNSNRQLLESHAQLAAEVEALRSEIAETRVLPPGASPKRIDRALEVEMLEMLEKPTTGWERQQGDEAFKSVEQRRREQESWIAEVALEALAAASELPSTARGGRRGGKSTGAAPDEAQGSADGPMVRAVRWLERWLQRK